MPFIEGDDKPIGESDLMIRLYDAIGRSDPAVFQPHVPAGMRYSFEIWKSSSNPLFDHPPYLDRGWPTPG